MSKSAAVIAVPAAAVPTPMPIIMKRINQKLLVEITMKKMSVL